MEIVEFGPLSDEQRKQLEGDEPDPFDAAGITLCFRPKDRHVGLSERDGLLIASAGMVLAEAEVADRRFPVVGIGGVIVNKDYRGRGHARRVVGAALARARTLGPAFAILFCHQNRLGLYRRLGFSAIADPVSVRQPDGYTRMTQETMWTALAPDVQWPRGALVLHSLPF
jgi:GNAT superfamily N-acetyltransferase